eukprot:gene7220-8602_t
MEVLNGHRQLFEGMRVLAVYGQLLWQRSTRGADEGANAAQGNKGAEAMGKGAVIKTMADCMMDACSPSTHGDPISALAHKAVGASVDLKTPQVVLVAEVVQVVCRHDASATQVAQTASGNCQVCALSVIGDDLITNVPK